METALIIAAITIVYAAFYLLTPKTDEPNQKFIRTLFLIATLLCALIGTGLIYTDLYAQPQTATTQNQTVTNVYHNYTFVECSNCTTDNLGYYSYPQYNESAQWWTSYEWIPQTRTNGTTTCCKNVTTPVLFSQTTSTTESQTVTPARDQEQILQGFLLLNITILVLILAMIILNLLFGHLQKVNERKYGNDKIDTQL